jgi:hypothetical protein
MMRTALVAILLAWLLPAAGAETSSTLYTTHFFDWYRVTPQQPYEAIQKVFTFRPDWESVGLSPNEVGVSQRYYSVQFRMIQRAGFDGIHYEWFGTQPSSECIAALEETRTRVAMFYDMEIRFNGRPLFIKPTDVFAKEVLDDVGSFYDRVPKNLWLHEADGSIPLIFYGYQFDQSYRDVSLWHDFYRKLLDGLREKLGAPVRIYWTDCGALCQTYAFQHFPEISSYSFSWWGGQRQIGARSVTFVVHYDDRGAVVGGRTARTMSYDSRFLEEHLQLARLTKPRLIFNYGWNEYFEGEHIFPDTTWGDWRLRTMSAIVSNLRTATPKPLTPVIVLADDLYAGDIARQGSRDAEQALLGAFRYLFPQAETRLGADVEPPLDRTTVIIAMGRNRTEQQEKRLLSLAQNGKAKVVFYEPDPEHTGPLVRAFASGPRKRPLAEDAPPPANQWVGAEIPVDVDAARYPFLRIRVRNSPNTFYHIRVVGTDTDGKSHENHDNQSPLDWRSTGGQWEERRENVKAILEAYAGKTITKFTGLVVIVNAMSTPGDFSAEFADAEFIDADGNVGLRVPLGEPSAARYRASFANTGRSSYPFGAMEPGGASSGRLKLILRARYAADQPLDPSSQAFAFQPGVEALAWSSWPPADGGTPSSASVRIPLVLRKGNVFWVNTLSPHARVYGPLMSALGLPPCRMAEHIQFQQVKGVTTVQRPRALTILGRDPLPIPWVRFFHPEDVKMPIAYPWPATATPLAAVKKRGGKESPVVVTTVISKTRLTPAGQAEMQPGDTLDIYRVPVRIVPAKGTVQVRSVRLKPGLFQLDLSGGARATITPLASGVAVSRANKPVSGPLRTPCTVSVRIGNDGERTKP